MKANARIQVKPMNQTEAAYARGVLEPARLAGELVWWAFEAMKFRLADNTHYTPDFVVLRADGEVEAHEIKATWSHGGAGFTDDARVKVKVAASLFPWIRFKVARPEGRKHARVWKFEEIQAREIGMA
jgi:hypothetical protein